MLAHLRTRLTYANVMSTIAVFGVLGGVGYASIPSHSGGTIAACYVPSSGQFVKFIDEDNGETCGVEQEVLRWNQTGPRGLTGPRGPAGSSGSRLGAVKAGAVLAAGRTDQARLDRLLARNSRTTASTRASLRRLIRRLRRRGILKRSTTLHRLLAAGDAGTFVLQDKIDSLGDLSLEKQMRIQIYSDHYNQLVTALSNIVKSVGQTQDSITSNLK